MHSAKHDAPIITPRVVLLAMFFISCLIVANFTAIKIAEIHLTPQWAISFPAALLFFPLTYFFDDTLTEVYGFKMSRLIIWGGLFCSAMVNLCTWLAVYLPASPLWNQSTHNGELAYEFIFKGTPRVFIASALAYFCGEFFNSLVLAKMKVYFCGKFLWLRILVSSAFGVAIDTTLFSIIAFAGILPSALLWQITLTAYLFKLSFECLMLPITYKLIDYLKNRDQIDYYDTKTRFNPFSLRLKD